jgi:hypothetical protein
LKAFQQLLPHGTCWNSSSRRGSYLPSLLLLLFLLLPLLLLLVVLC